MYNNKRLLKILVCLLLLACFQITSGTKGFCQENPPVTDKLEKILARITPELSRDLSVKGFALGSPIFIRIFKLQGELELWIEKNSRFELYKKYPVCSYSGYLGPKIREGDWQSPEGFYRVTSGQMNPLSSYHLSFDIGYPNTYDSSLGRNGGNIMIHGGCSSRGCFAMNDQRIEEIYTLAHFALSNGQDAFDVHIFPFPLSDENLEKFSASPWIEFWENLQQGYAAFEQEHRVPVVTVKQGNYSFDDFMKMAMTAGQE